MSALNPDLVAKLRSEIESVLWNNEEFIDATYELAEEQTGLKFEATDDAEEERDQIELARTDLINAALTQLIATMS